LRKFFQACGLYAAALLALAVETTSAQPANPAQAQSPYDHAVPPAVRGPFVSDPAIVTELDCPDGQCNGALNFSRLMQARVSTREKVGGNPFNLKVARQIRKTIEADLDELASRLGVGEFQLSRSFLTDVNSRVELVGVINRMDRRFIKDTSQGLRPDQLACGEISVIYRFAYSLTDRDQQSRLPVTLNIVFPALPSDTKKGAVTCQTVARRWLDMVRNGTHGDAKTAAAALIDPKSGPLAFIDGRDLLRVELNMQAYRRPASDVTDFGTEAAYVLRVFKWLPDKSYFDPDFMRNQLDRDKVSCKPSAPANCVANRQRRKRLVEFLSKQSTLEDLDKGTMELDDNLKVLAKQGLSISPGGSHRSNNQPYWNADTDAQQIITDLEIQRVLDAAFKNKAQLSFIKSKEDFRTRLNESTCTGCHQTRAIAGFHFPGADRAGTSAVNSVLLPGSPQFYGDQPRRMEILEKIASGRSLTQYELATGYSARPMNKYRPTLDQTQLIGGWGGACLIDSVISGSQRQWTCRDDFKCVQLFESGNDPGIGTCVPKGDMQIGDALQRGEVKTKSFGNDHYLRRQPQPAQDGDTRIPPSALPSNPPAGNSYYGHHQEYYEGVSNPDNRDDLRDAQTGGFPSGMLRLSECLGLPNHSTCGLVASTGFNKCISKLATDPEFTIKVCFAQFTSYAGLRACDAASPCRDDYICVKPMEGYAPDMAQGSYDKRKQALIHSALFKKITGKWYKPEDYYGQTMADAAWVNRNDQRGLCIPPYFVFQFRADGHPAPTKH
jgi:hypothetical protein